MLNVVGDKNHSQTLIACPRNQPQHDRRLMNAKRRSWLVQNEDPGAEVNRPRNRQRLPLATRQGADCLGRSRISIPILANSSTATRFIRRQSRRRSTLRPTVGSRPTKKLRATTHQQQRR